MTTQEMLRKPAIESITSDVIPYHRWTHDCDKVRILKCVGADRKGYNGFQWPESGLVAPETWSEEPTCQSGGLFGWAWGLAFGDGKDPDYQTNLWIVFEADPADVVLIEGGKVKARCGDVVFCGRLGDAMSRFILAGQMGWCFYASSGAASNSGDRGAASNSGYSGAASNSGSSGAASNSGSSGAASNSGDRGAALNTAIYGSAIDTSSRGIAASTGEESLLESSATGLGCTTADKFRWLLRAGAILCQRTEKGCWLLKAEDFGDDGETVTIEHGVKIALPVVAACGE